MKTTSQFVMPPLPVTAVIPTFNCRPKLEGHMKNARKWLPFVREIIAVDSESSDGTYEYLEETLACYDAKIITVGPGLYAAWNKGVSLATQPYVYFSTVGEIISLEGLKKLYTQASRANTDVIISPPAMVSDNGTSCEKRWPIHDVTDHMSARLGDCYVPDRGETILLFAGSLPETILGSSASNLYRTIYLQTNPFPTDVGSEGDVFWGIRNMSTIKIALLLDCFSSFLWDGDRRKSYQYLYALARKLNDELNECLGESTGIPSALLMRQARRNTKFLKILNKITRRKARNASTVSGRLVIRNAIKQLGLTKAGKILYRKALFTS